MRAVRAFLAAAVLAGPLVAGSRHARATSLGGDDVAADRAALLEGVEVLERLGVPGSVAVFGERAFGVLTGGKEPLALVAAARLGEGRVVAIGHGAYVEAGIVGEEGSGAERLARNAVRWCAGEVDEPRVAVLGASPTPLAAALARDGLDVRRVGGAPTREGTDVLVWADGRVGAGELSRAIAEFVEAGGGLVVAMCPWGWEQVNPGRSLANLADSPHDALLVRAGLCFGRGYPEPNADGGYAVTASRAEAVHAGRALERLVAGEEVPPESLASLEEAVRLLPAEAAPFRATLAELTDGAALDSPSPDRPLPRADVRRRLAVLARALEWSALAPEDVPVAPGADAFPGAVPAGAPRIETTLELAPGEPGWRGTGLYLAPGEMLEVAASGARGWRVRVGCHADVLWGLAEWRRWPEITIERDLVEGATRLASPFGGAVYFVEGPGAGPLRVTVRGAVLAPRYALDGEGNGVWLVPRDAPAPWTELEARHLVLSVPTSALAGLPDPGPVLAWWDRLVRSHLELAGREPPARRERFVADAQIVAGYMHAGYPIMTWLDKVTPPAGGGPPPLLDLARLSKEGDWGYFHELGHNLQRPAWTFGGTGEVTCNLFSLYSMQALCGIEAWEHPFLDGAKRALPGHLEAGAPFERWRRDPGLALATYARLQEEFGWEPFRRVLRDYEALAPGQLPRTDARKIDGWVRRLSFACGRDLRAYHGRWGWPLGEALRADAELDALAPWRPAEWRDSSDGGDGG